MENETIRMNHESSPRTGLNPPHKGRNVLSQQGILERSIGLRVMLVAALLLVVGGAFFVATRSADALGTDIVIADGDYDGNYVDAPGGNLAANIDVDDPTDQAAAAVEATIGANIEAVSIPGTGTISAAAVALGVLVRMPAIGGAADFIFELNGDAVAGGDIVTVTVSLGGINAVTGSSTIQIITGDADAGAAGNTSVAAHPVLGAVVDGGGFSLFAQGVAGRSDITVTTGGQTADTVSGAGGLAPKADFVGLAATVAAATPVGGIGAGAPVSLLNPTAFSSGSTAQFSGGLTGGLREHGYYFVATDSAGAQVLDANVVTIALTNITGGATLTPSFGSVGAGAGQIIATGVTDDQVALGGIGLLAANAANHGTIAVGITTAAATAASGTLTISVAGFGAAEVSISFTASGPGAAMSISTPAAADAVGNAGANFAATGEPVFVVTLTDSAGVAVTGATPANVATKGVMSVAQPAGGPLRFSSAGAATAAAAGVAERAALPGAAVAIAAAAGLSEIGQTGTYSLGVASVAGTAAGDYAFTISLNRGAPAAVVATLVGSVRVAGAAATATTTSITDQAGTVITDAPSVGQGEIITVTLNWLAADGSPVANASASAQQVTLGTLTANTATNDAGNTTHRIVAGNQSGNSTLTVTIGTVTHAVTFEVGGTGGAVTTSLAASGATARSATAGDQVSLTVIASDSAGVTGDALVAVTNSGGSVSNDLISANAAGEASVFATSASAGTVIVEMTAVTQGTGGVLIPVADVDAVVFTITFAAVAAEAAPAATSVALSDAAASTFVSWTGAEANSSVFANVGGLTIVWFWNGTEWLAYVPDGVAALQTSFVVPNGGVLYIVTTAAVSVPVS